MTDIKNMKTRKHKGSFKISQASQVSHPYDRILCLILSNIKILRFINPINSNDYKQKYMKGDIPSKCPEFKYREINFDISAVKGSLTTLKPVDDKTLVLYRKAIEILHKLEMLEARGTLTFREISRLLYGSVNINDVRKISNWLNVEDENPTEIHYDALAMKKKLDIEILKINLEVKVILRQFQTSKAAAGFNTLGLKARGMYNYEDFTRIIAHEIETHIYRNHNGIQQGLKSLFFHGFPRSDAYVGGYLVTEEGLALMMEEKAGVLSQKRKRIIAGRVLAIYLMDIEELNFNEVFEILTKTHKFSPNTAYDICIRTFRAGGYTKDHIYFRGYELVKQFFQESNIDEQRLLFSGKIGIEWIPMLKTMQANGEIVEPKHLPDFLKKS